MNFSEQQTPQIQWSWGFVCYTIEMIIKAKDEIILQQELHDEMLRKLVVHIHGAIHISTCCRKYRIHVGNDLTVLFTF